VFYANINSIEANALRIPQTHADSQIIILMKGDFIEFAFVPTALMKRKKKGDRKYKDCGPYRPKRKIILFQSLHYF
jgi:hypothetical protein